MPQQGQTFDRPSLLAAISGILAEVLGGDASAIGEHTAIFDELGLDSTSVLEVLMRLEDELSVAFDTDTLEQHHFQTVGTLADYLAEQV